MRNELHSRNPKTVIYGTETIFFLFPKICALIPQNICHKNIIDSSSLPCFKKSIRKWKPNCLCRLCKIILQHVGFIQLNNSPPFSIFSLVYLKFIYLFIFILHIISKNYSYIISLRICFNFQKNWFVIGFTLYCNSYVKVNRNKVIIIIITIIGSWFSSFYRVPLGSHQGLGFPVFLGSCQDLSFLVFLGSCQGPTRVLVFQFSQGPTRVPLGPQVLVFWYATAFDSS